MSLLDDIALGMESLEADGVKKNEVEYEIYGCMKDIGLLGSAERTELQEQWGLPIAKVAGNAASGSLRVRMIDDTQYVFTSKIKIPGANEEVEHEVGEDLFTHFKKFADQGLRKMRHFFPVPGTDFIYEVDAFYNSVGQLIPWVKIDLEMPEGMVINDLPDLPFELEDIRVIPPGKKSPEDLEFVKELFNKYFNLPNQYIDPHAPGAVSAESNPGELSTDQLLENADCFSTRCRLYVNKYPEMAEPIIARYERLRDTVGTQSEHLNDYHAICDSWYLKNVHSDQQMFRTWMVDLTRVERLFSLPAMEAVETIPDDNPTQFKKELIDLANRMDNLAGVLSFNESEVEASVRQALEEAVQAVQKLYRPED